MIRISTGLSAEDREAIAELDARTVAADGGRLKLEWGVLNSRPDDRAQDLLYFADGELVGFLGIYAFGHEQAELAGMVDPGHRRRGIGTEMLQAARPLLEQQGHDRALLVCSHIEAGAAFARARGGTFDHAEHAMVLRGAPAEGPENPAVALRLAGIDDAPDIARILEAGFGYQPGDVAARLNQPGEQDIVIELDGKTVGYVRLTLDGERGGVYGFVVEPSRQGKGIGRDVLRRACLRLRAAGATTIGLEVAVENERALGLYTSIGFERVTTEQYFRLPLSSP